MGDGEPPMRTLEMPCVLGEFVVTEVWTEHGGLRVPKSRKHPATVTCQEFKNICFFVCFVFTFLK